MTSGPVKSDGNYEANLGSAQRLIANLTYNFTL